PMHNIFLGLLRHHGTEFFGLKKKENNNWSDPDDLDCLVQQDNISDVDSNNDSNDSDSISMSSGAQKKKSCSEAYQYNQINTLLFSTSDNLQLLCNVIQEIRLPSHIGHIPGTVGQAKGGKLKAEEWINLFSILLMPTFLLIMKKSSSQLSISNLVRQNRTTDEDINNLEEHLKIYWQGILRLYPQVSTKPNHHLELHLPQCISCLGPAPCWTSWTFERLNGSLAAIPTNNKIGELNSTLLAKWATAQNFLGILPVLCNKLPSQLANSLKQLVNPSKNVATLGWPDLSRHNDSSSSVSETPDLSRPYDQFTPVPDLDSANHLEFSKQKLLEDIDHTRLLKRLVEIDGYDLVAPADQFRNWRKPIRSPILAHLIHYGTRLSFNNFEFKTRQRHPGNSTIHYQFKSGRSSSKLRYGQIIKIFT
ncbi:hypothetical protein VP01_6191g1, partial [Puccinia sorghi]